MARSLADGGGRPARTGKPGPTLRCGAPGVVHYGGEPPDEPRPGRPGRSAALVAGDAGRRASLLVAVVLLLLLGVAGVDQIDALLLFAVLVVSALVGGWVVRRRLPRSAVRPGPGQPASRREPGRGPVQLVR